MISDNVRRVRQKGIAALVNHVKLVASLISSAIVISGAAWWLFGDHIQPYLDVPGDIQEIRTTERQIIERIDEQGKRVSMLEDRVTRLHRPKVVEFDDFRSRILSKDCKRGGLCNGIIIFRRTEQGISCDLPEVKRFIKDVDGIHVAGAGTEPPQVHNGVNWIDREIQFRVPATVTIGPAIFFAKLEFRHCDFAPPAEVITEVSPPLEFNIIAGS